MLLLEIGPVIFGGIDAIFAYLWRNGLLSTNKDCSWWEKQYIWKQQIDLKHRCSIPMQEQPCRDVSDQYSWWHLQDKDKCPRWKYSPEITHNIAAVDAANMYVGTKVSSWRCCSGGRCVKDNCYRCIVMASRSVQHYVTGTTNHPWWHSTCRTNRQGPLSAQWITPSAL